MVADLLWKNRNVPVVSGLYTTTNNSSQTTKNKIFRIKTNREIPLSPVINNIKKINT